MYIKQIFRYGRPYESETEERDGFVNFFYATKSPGCKKPLLDAGINTIEEVKAKDGVRRPAILISSSPHKIGSEETPWQDFFDTDNGHIRYYGDNKSPDTRPEDVAGNAVLLEQYSIQNSLDPEERAKSVPIIFYKRVPMNGKKKGYVEFHGFGVIERVEKVTQLNLNTGRSFPNYVFDFVVLDLFDENDRLNWEWITKRRDKTLLLEETLEHAPDSWKAWIREGKAAKEKLRRRISKLQITKTSEQKPVAGSREKVILDEIYDYYTNISKKSRFEALAAKVAARVIRSTNGHYMEGWITPPSNDGGSDFIGRTDVGSDFSSVKLIVLGQAKCESPENATNGNSIARTVARLKRGWMGVYVTTSFFSNAVQREVIEDQYPILMIHGLRLAQEVIEMLPEEGFFSLLPFLQELDNTYDSLIQSRRPEEIQFF